METKDSTLVKNKKHKIGYKQNVEIPYRMCTYVQHCTKNNSLHL